MKPRNFFYFFYTFFLLLVASKSTIAANMGGEHNLLLSLQQSEHYLRQQLVQQLSQHDYQNVKIETKSLDPRLKLKQCDKPLTFEHQQTEVIKGNIAIKVTCLGVQQWSFYVKHIVALEKPILSINRNLPKHHIISEEDLAYITRDIYKLRTAYINNKQEAIGQQLKRPLKSGAIIYQYALQAPDIIKKGDAISIIASHSGLSVVTPGIAMSDGRKGEQIKVENRRSSRVIRAKIIGPNTVKVIL